MGLFGVGHEDFVANKHYYISINYNVDTDMPRSADAKGAGSKKKLESRAEPLKTSETACDSRSHGCTNSSARSELVRENGPGDMATNANNTGPSSARDALM